MVNVKLSITEFESVAACVIEHLDVILAQIEAVMNVLNLPSNIIINLFCSWVEDNDLTKLDTAHCNHALRQTLLEILRSSKLVISGIGSSAGYANPTDWLTWHTRRAVKVSAITFCIDMNDVPVDVLMAALGTVVGNHVSSVTFSYLDDGMRHLLFIAVVGCKLVKHLCLLDCVDSAGIRAVILNWSQALRTFSAERSNVQFSYIGGLKLPSVRKIKLVECFEADDVRTLLQCTCQLTEVILEHMRLADVCLVALEAHAVYLTRLELDEVYGVGGVALVKLGKLCSSLRVLFLTVPHDADGVVEAFVATATQLTTLGMRGRIDDSSLIAVTKHCGNRLRHLCVEITAGEQQPVNGLAALAQHCTALQSLCCYHGIYATQNHHVLHVITAQKGLLSIDFSGLNITDAFLEEIPRSCTQLQEILLLGSSGYTAAGIMQLIRGSRSLRRVQVEEDHHLITELVRLTWSELNRGVRFDHSDKDEAQTCWRYDPR
jgi:hypothetical protein